MRVIIIISMIHAFSVNAGIEQCGVDENNPLVKQLSVCDSKNSPSTSVKQNYDCYLNIYESAMEDLKSKSISEASPELRDFLSLTRNNFQISDNPKKLLNYYETTELVRMINECQDNAVQIFFPTAIGHEVQNRSCNVSGEKLSIAQQEAMRSQTLHYALFNAGRNLNKLKKLLKKPSSRNFRYEEEPTAFQDCRNGIAPGIYPPENYLTKKEIEKKDRDKLGCPKWVEEFNSCNQGRQEINKLEDSFLYNEMFVIGVELQLKGFAEQLLTKNPSSLKQDYKNNIATKIKTAMDKCFTNDQSNEIGSLNKQEIMKNFRDPLEDDPYFTKDGFEEYEKMEANEVAKSIKRLKVLEQYYAKISKKLARLNKYFYGKCSYIPFLPNMPTKPTDECLEAQQKILDFNQSIVMPIQERIKNDREKFPFLSIPLAGGEFGSATCFTGIVEDMVGNPLSYVMYGPASLAIKNYEWKAASKDVHYNMNCGKPLWKGASNLYKAELTGKTLWYDHGEDYENLLKIIPPKNWQDRGQYPDVENLYSLIDLELDNKNPTSEINKTLDFLNQLDNLPSPSEDEINLTKKLKLNADIGIEEALLSTLKDACDDPLDYGKELLANDQIGKVFFSKHNLSPDAMALFCRKRSEFINQSKSTEENLMAASIGIGALGFIHPVAAVAVLPVEFGLEYAQYQEMASDKRRHLSLALFNLEDYTKAEEEIATLKSEELMFYGMIGAMALGGVGDIADVVGDLGKVSRATRGVSKLSKAVDALPDSSKQFIGLFKSKIAKIEASDLSELEKRLAVLNEWSRLEKTLPPDEFFEIMKVIGHDVDSIKKLAARDIKFELARDFAKSDLSHFIDDLQNLENSEQMDILISAYRKAKSSPENFDEFIQTIKRRGKACGV